LNERLPRVTAANAVPFHAGTILHPKVLKSILRDADWTIGRFKELAGL